MNVSVIITNYNYGQYIVECINSVLNQTKKVDEIIVVDDGSTDDSRKILTENYATLKNIKLVFNKNAGQIAAAYSGFTQSTSDIITFLDADDVYKPNFIEKSCDVFEKNQDIGHVICGWEEFGSSESIILPYGQTSFNFGSLVIAGCQSFWLNAPTSMRAFRRDILLSIMQEDCLQFSGITKGHIDLFLNIGSLIYGTQTYYIAETLAMYRKHSTSHSTLSDRSRLNDLTHKLLREKMTEFFRKNFYILSTEAFKYSKHEFRLIEKPDKKLFKCYFFSPFKCTKNIFKKIEWSLSIFRQYISKLIKNEVAKSFRSNRYR